MVTVSLIHCWCLNWCLSSCIYAVLLTQYGKAQGSVLVYFVKVGFVQNAVLFLGHNDATMLESYILKNKIHVPNSCLNSRIKAFSGG